MFFRNVVCFLLLATLVGIPGTPRAYALPEAAGACPASLHPPSVRPFYGNYSLEIGQLAPLHVRVGKLGIRITFNDGTKKFFSWKRMQLEPLQKGYEEYTHSFLARALSEKRFKFGHDLTTGLPFIQYQYRRHRKDDHLLGFRAYAVAKLVTSIKKRVQPFWGKYVAHATPFGTVRAVLSPEGIRVSRGKDTTEYSWSDFRRAPASQYGGKGVTPVLALAHKTSPGKFLAIEKPSGGVSRIRLWYPVSDYRLENLSLDLTSTSY